MGKHEHLCKHAEEHTHEHAHEHTHTHEHEGCSCSHHCHDECGTHESTHAEIIKLAVCAVLFLAGLFVGNETIKAILFIGAYIAVGYDILYGAAKNILKGEIFDEIFLMSIASLGAVLIGKYSEGTAVMALYRIGEMLQDAAESKSRRKITSLMNIKAEHAVVLKDGKEVVISPEDVKPGDVMIVRPGEKVALDGEIIKGKCFADMSALTGESAPVEKGEKDEILSGSIVLNASIEVLVKKEYTDSMVAKILSLVEEASEKKSKTQNFVTKFSRYYTPIVCGLALIIGFVPPIFGGSLKQWIYTGLTFLVISCPCALVISVPVAYFGGIGAASSKGILIKGSNYIDILSNVERAVFDKTGTLTKGKFDVHNEIVNEGHTKEELAKYACIGEHFSNHPIAKSILEKYGSMTNDDDINSASDFIEEAGYGTECMYDGKKLLCGNRKLMEKYGVDAEEPGDFGTKVYVAYDGEYIGAVIIGDEIKPDSAKGISELHKCGVKKVTILTGDNEIQAKTVCEKVGADDFKAHLLPDEKVLAFEEIKKNCKSGHVIFAGDGINDAPVLAMADVGIAMGGMGSDAASQAADIVLMTDEISKISAAIKISRKTRKIVYENITFILAVKFIIMALGVFGVSSMWAAVFADVGTCIITILNSLRILKD